MLDDLQAEKRVEWRRLLEFDFQSVAAVLGCALFLIGLLGLLPSWLRTQERADFRGAALQTAPGTIATVQISPVSQGGGGLFNAVTVAFAHREIYYALPPTSHWQPKRGDAVRVKYRIGVKSGKVQIDSVEFVPSPPAVKTGITKTGLKS